MIQEQWRARTISKVARKMLENKHLFSAVIRIVYVYLCRRRHWNASREPFYSGHIHTRGRAKLELGEDSDWVWEEERRREKSEWVSEREKREQAENKRGKQQKKIIAQSVNDWWRKFNVCHVHSVYFVSSPKLCGAVSFHENANSACTLHFVLFLRIFFIFFSTFNSIYVARVFSRSSWTVL